MLSAKRLRRASPLWRRALWNSVAAILALSTAPANSTEGLKHRVDFRNFTYPWVDLDSWPDHLEWLSQLGSKAAKLENGRWPLPEDEPRPSSLPFAGLTFDSVVYGDLTGDGEDEAIVALRFD